jgi:ankyrin repeat protein
MAAEFDNVVAAEILIKNGSKVMPKDNKGKTPLDYAESAEMILLLKKSGAKEL